MKINLYRLGRALIMCGAVLGLPGNAVAGNAGDELVGTWTLKRGTGSPCATAIERLRYRFGKDGTYDATTTLKNASAPISAKGTYSATGTSATAYVNGLVIGPYPYRIINDLLIVTQPEFGCEVVMEREDY